VPSQWKQETIIPILKKDKDPRDIKNYRPPSLSRLVAKPIMRMVARSTNYDLEISIILAGEQARFRQYISTQQHVAMFSQNIKDALLQRKYLKCCGFLL
jgi:hypothetical protein